MKYKGYEGSVEIDLTTEVLYGKVLYIPDMVVYQGGTVAGLKKAFEAAVDNYLEECKRAGKTPSLPFPGRLHINIGPRLHEEVATLALSAGRSIDDVVSDALSTYLC